MQEWFAELSEFLRIPSISADPTHVCDVRRAADWICTFVRDAGGSCNVVDWSGNPLVIGEIRASAKAEQAPTVLCYGHFDVQPPDPLDRWESDPFEPEIRGDYLYGRGTVDDKGQLYMLLAAARSLARAGRLPVNVRFCCDGEEETGGQSVVEFIEQDKREAEAAIIFDSSMIRPGVPAFVTATRGLCYFHIVLRTGRHDLHSGLLGGAALNAAHALIQTLDALIACDGRVVDSLRQGVVPPGREELAQWRELPAGAAELAAQGARPKDPKAADDLYTRTFAEPAVDINGIACGSPWLQKTVLPVEAVANVSIRLVAGQRAGDIQFGVEKLLREAAPEGADLEIRLLASLEPGLVSPESNVVQLGLNAFERVLGVRPMLIRSGGSGAVVPALARRGIPAIVTGFGLPDSQIHAPNERLVAAYVPLGITTAQELLLELALL